MARSKVPRRPPEEAEPRNGERQQRKERQQREGQQGRERKGEFAHSVFMCGASAIEDCRASF